MEDDRSVYREQRRRNVGNQPQANEEEDEEDDNPSPPRTSQRSAGHRRRHESGSVVAHPDPAQHVVEGSHFISAHYGTEFMPQFATPSMGMDPYGQWSQPSQPS